MSVIIGVDPHKATHTAVAIDRSESEVRPGQGPSDAPAGPAAVMSKPSTRACSTVAAAQQQRDADDPRRAEVHGS